METIVLYLCSKGGAMLSLPGREWTFEHALHYRHVDELYLDRDNGDGLGLQHSRNCLYLGSRRLPPRCRRLDGVRNRLAGPLGFLDSEIEFQFAGLREVRDDRIVSSGLDQLFPGVSLSL